MQLVEQGKLDLDKDVSQYLDFPIPPAFGKPITLRDILTHTSGYEETARDLFVADAQHLFPLDQYLKNHMPERIFPPSSFPLIPITPPPSPATSSSASLASPSNNMSPNTST